LWGGESRVEAENAGPEREQREEAGRNVETRVRRVDGGEGWLAGPIGLEKKHRLKETCNVERRKKSKDRRVKEGEKTDDGNAR